MNATAKQFNHPWFHTFLRLDPKAALSKVACPVLAINGEKDVQVEAQRNLRIIRETLPPTTPKRIISYPNLNHLFQQCKTGEVSEYRTIEETINVRVMQDIVQWIRQLPES